MQIPFDKYCGDKKLTELLEKAGSKLTISEIYGLLYGCIATPHMVMPSKIMPFLFGEEGTSLETLDDAKELYGNIMSLWNVIARWEPESEPFSFPDIEYPGNYEGLKQRIKDDSSLIMYFIKGFDLGESSIEADLSEDGLKAYKTLLETNVLLSKSLELIDTEIPEDKELEKLIDSIDTLEGILADCFARINIGLKGARMRVVEEMRRFTAAQKDADQARSTKIPRNAPCPCGSGKKYKKCCGLIH